MSHYSEGIRIEHIVIHDLQKNGYATTRAASSKGVADVIAIKAGEVVLVNVKRTTMPGTAERRQLMAVAAMIPDVAVPLVALKPTRCELTYRRLVGYRASDWVEWHPDYAKAAS